MTRGDAPSSQPETRFALRRTGERPPTKESSEKACYRCAKRGHTADKCRMESWQCNICKKTGHIAKACRSKGNGSKEWKRIAASSSRISDNVKARAAYQVDEQDVCTIYNFNGKESPKVNVDIAGRSFEMIMDTGASIIVIPEDVHKAELAQIKLQKSTVRLQSYCGK